MNLRTRPYEAVEGCPDLRVRIYNAFVNDQGEPRHIQVQYVGTAQALIAAGIATAAMLTPLPPRKRSQRRLDADGDYFQVRKQGRAPHGDRSARYSVTFRKAPEAALRLPGARAVWRLEEWQARQRIDAEEHEAWRGAEAARRPLPPSRGSFEVAGPDTWQSAASSTGGPPLGGPVLSGRGSHDGLLRCTVTAGATVGHHPRKQQPRLRP